MLSDSISISHFGCSIIALITGTLVLANTKGTLNHKRIGYLYSFSMFVVLVTSFLIYNLHGTFGVLHFFAVVSSLTLLAGLLPMWFKYPKNYMGHHLSFMYWSVIGLYCAFAAEVFTRIPFFFEIEKNILPIFYSLVGVSSAIVAAIGGRYFKKYKDSWMERFVVEK